MSQNKTPTTYYNAATAERVAAQFDFAKHVISTMNTFPKGNYDTESVLETVAEQTLNDLKDKDVTDTDFMRLKICSGIVNKDVQTMREMIYLTNGLKDIYKDNK